LLRLLDVGCGFGHTLALARELGLEGYGTDISRESLAYCRKQGLQVYEPQDFDGQYPDLKFDIIITQSILEHAVDLNAFMSWVAGRAKQGTILYVNGLTPKLIDVERKTNSFVKAHFVEHINYFPLSALRVFMRGHGFTEMEREVIMVNARGIKVPRILVSVARKVMRRGAIKVFSKYYRYDAGAS
jgi:SAM-dependent methyltransferase